MVIIILERVPVSLRGLLSRWMLEPRAGVFVGTPPARVRDKLWGQISQRLDNGGAVMIHSAATEQGFVMHITGDPSRRIESFEGLQLVRIPHRTDDGEVVETPEATRDLTNKG